ncbi:MAG: M28 family peptidase [Gammaproteobacteria bacterium]|nr:M28 family peptidase [Gammaproteobacteria bacterium]
MNYGLFVLSMLALAACNSVEETPTNTRSGAANSITGAEIRQHMEVLAADDMRGRAAGTADYDRAADYVADRYRKIGLLPLGDGGSYFQSIRFFETRLAPGSASFSVARDDSQVELVFRDDFIRAGGYGEQDEDITAPLVFVGHGIVAPEYGHDDFADVDVAGKILVSLSGAPPGFATDQRAFYSSSRGKQAIAMERGAVGIINVRTPVDQKRRPWERYLAGVGSPGMRWLDEEGAPHQGYPQLAGSATVSEAGAEKLFALADADLDALFTKHAAGDTGSFDMDISATLGRRSNQRTVRSSNVVGMLKGSDPELRGQYIVYTAHLDHIGVRPGSDGDDIHNGAYDNAAGIGTILEIAAAMAVMDTGPRRSIIFAAVTAEEKGLQGSSYFAMNPPVPAEQLVANINIDMPYLGFPVGDVHAFGAEHSTLLSAVQEATILSGLELTPDPLPDEVRFVRSDQFSFVKQGVPALALKPGSMSLDPATDGAAALDDFLKNHYHRASDDLSLPYDNAAAERFARTGLLVGLIVADRQARPRWNDGDFFGDKFAR